MSSDSILTSLARRRSEASTAVGVIAGHSLRRLWNCKVGVFSILVGFALMTLFPEARDLFNDRVGVLGLAEYALLVLVVWSLQVWLSAKGAIARATTVAVSPPEEGRDARHVRREVRIGLFPLRWDC